jgi:hypothetical protein
MFQSSQNHVRMISFRAGSLFESYDDISNPPDLPEPEAALLLVACGIGLLTGVEDSYSHILTSRQSPLSLLANMLLS